MNKLKCFKSYDIRGKIPEEFNKELAYKIACSYAKIINPSRVIVGYDARIDSPQIAKSVIEGLMHSGVNVVDIGLCGTEEVYFHTFHQQKDGVGGGIMITASHNPKGYNGMKMVKYGSRPLTESDDLQKIHDNLFDQTTFNTSCGNYIKKEDKSDYISHLLSYIDTNKLKPLKIVVNSGNGSAVIIIKLLEKFLPYEFIYINEEIDGNFPNGVPNPMIAENRISTSKAVIEHKADLGIAWDGDFDRCFFFDENGEFIEAYYIIGLLASSLLKKSQGEKIIHDPRLIWNTQDIIKKYKAIAVQCKSGHSFIKEKMREEDALYGGESSAHHYFKKFAYCDSGMIPWLLISKFLINSGVKFSELIASSASSYPCSNEINYKVDNIQNSIEKIKQYFSPQNPIIDYTDGISLEFSDWRFNLRGSNTEPLLRLNLETRGKNKSITTLIAEIESILY